MKNESDFSFAIASQPLQWEVCAAMFSVFAKYGFGGIPEKSIQNVDQTAKVGTTPQGRQRNMTPNSIDDPLITSLLASN